MTKAFASLLSKDGDRKVCRIRFNSYASDLLANVPYVTLGKNANYIVLIPQKLSTSTSVRVGKGVCGETYISMNKAVYSHGFLSESLFDGTRYAVKKTKDGKICICLKEVVIPNGYEQRRTHEGKR